MSTPLTAEQKREPEIVSDCRRNAQDSTIGENARQANQQYVDAYDSLLAEVRRLEGELADARKQLFEWNDKISDLAPHTSTIRAAFAYAKRKIQECDSARIDAALSPQTAQPDPDEHAGGKGMMERDSRVDPRPGDVLCNRLGIERKVFERDDALLGKEVGYLSAGWQKRRCRLAEWREWCFNTGAVVIQNVAVVIDRVDGKARYYPETDAGGNAK